MTLEFITPQLLESKTAKKYLISKGKQNNRGKIELVIKDKQTKGLQIKYVESSTAPEGINITLFSIVHHGKEKQRKIWYSNIKDISAPDNTRLADIKAKATEWHSQQLQKARYNIITLAEYKVPYINSYSVQNTIKSYRYTLSLFEELMNKDISTLTAPDIIRHIQLKTKKSIEKHLSVFTNFLNFIYKQTINEHISDLHSKLTELKPKSKVSDKHFRTIMSRDNNELKESIIQGFTQLFLNPKNPTIKQEIVTRFLFPLRITELKSVTPNDIKDDYLHIRKTKTITEAQGGFDIPLSPEAKEQISQHPISSHSNNINYVLNKYFNISSHGIRSIFDTYFYRLDKYDSAIIEACLSHKEKNPIIRAYRPDSRNYYYDKRKPIMKEWYTFIFSCVKEAQDRATQSNITELKINDY